MTAYTMRTQIKLSPEALQKMKDASISGAENMAIRGAEILTATKNGGAQ